MTYTKFTVAGKHPLLYLARDYLIQSAKYELVPWDAEPAFCLYGGVLCKGDNLPKRVSALCKDYEAIRSTPMVILGATEGQEGRKGVFSSLVKEMFVPNGKAKVVQVYPVYGASVHTGVVHKFVAQAKRGEPLSVYRNGSQRLSLIHEKAFLKELEFIISGASSECEISGKQDISVLHLAETIWGFVHQRGGVQYKELWGTPVSSKLGHGTTGDTRTIRLGLKELV